MEVEVNFVSQIYVRLLELYNLRDLAGTRKLQMRLERLRTEGSP